MTFDSGFSSGFFDWVFEAMLFWQYEVFVFLVVCLYRLSVRLVFDFLKRVCLFVHVLGLIIQ